MKLLFINYEFPPLGAGGATANAYLARELVKLNQQVYVLTSGFKGLLGRQNINGYEVIRIPVIRRRKNRCSIFEMFTFIISGLFAAPRIAKQIKPDVVVAFFTIPSGPIALLLRWVYGIPYIISIRGGDVPGYPGRGLFFFHWLCKPLIRLIWKKALIVVGNSKGLIELAKNTLPDIDFPLVYTGIDLSLYSPPSSRPSPPPYMLLYVGRLTSEKGVDDLINAVALLKADQEIPETHLEIVGAGYHKAKLIQLARQLGIKKLIHFHKWLPRTEVIKRYQAAHIFVLPSLGEGFPNVVLEAMACGLPVVATRVMGTMEIVSDGETGILVEPRNPRQLATALADLIKDEEKRRHLANKALLEVTKLNWPTQAQKYLYLITNRLGGKEKRAKKLCSP